MDAVTLSRRVVAIHGKKARARLLAMIQDAALMADLAEMVCELYTDDELKEMFPKAVN